MACPNSLAPLALHGAKNMVARTCATSAMASAIAGASERIVSAEQRHQDRMLHVRWQDGQRAAFPYVWLRDVAPEQHRPRFVADLSVSVKPEQLVVDEQGRRLHIQWPPYQWVPYDSSWLRSAVELIPDSKTTWPTIDVEQHTHASGVAAYRFDSIRDRRTEIVAKLELDGCVRLTDCHQHHPAGVMHLLGLCSDTEVDATVQKRKAAMCDVMGLHTGRPNHTQPPKWLTVQVHHLNPRHPSECTGSLQVSDGHAVASHMKHNHPADYQFLTGTHIEYVGGEKKVRAEHPVIQLNGNRTPKMIVYNHALRSARLPCSVAHVDEYYVALQRFNAAAYKRATAIRPTHGDILIVDNHRMLHGNTAFKDERHRPQCELSETFFK